MITLPTVKFSVFYLYFLDRKLSKPTKRSTEKHTFWDFQVYFLFVFIYTNTKFRTISEILKQKSKNSSPAKPWIEKTLVKLKLTAHLMIPRQCTRL